MAAKGWQRAFDDPDCWDPPLRAGLISRRIDLGQDATQILGSILSRFRQALVGWCIIIERATALGRLWRHESGTYLKLTDSGAALFA